MQVRLRQSGGLASRQGVASVITAPPLLPPYQPPAGAERTMRLPQFPSPYASPTSKEPAPPISAFRRIYHFHLLPGVPRLVAAQDPSWTGDHTALTRYAGPLSLQFDHLARVVGLGAAHIFLGVSLGVLWWFGVRQSVHSMILGARNLRALKEQRQLILDQMQQERGASAALAAGSTTPVHIRALLEQNRSDKRQARYYMGLDGSAAIGAVIVGVGDLFRHALIGTYSKVLMASAIPVLNIGFGPLVAPGVIAATDRVTRAVRTRYKNNRMQTYLQTLDLPQAPAVGKLYQDRMRELRTYYLWDCAAFIGLVAGAATSVFAGPGGLLILVPSVLGVLTAEGFARRMTLVRDAVPVQERLQLKDDASICNSILEANDLFVPLQSMRRARKMLYPSGWGTRTRPVVRIWRAWHRHHHHVGADDPATKYRVLGTLSRHEAELDPYYNNVTPYDLYDLLDQTRMRDAFAKVILRDRVLRMNLHGRGVEVDGRKWRVIHADLVRFMCGNRWGADFHQFLIDRLYCRAEELLLTTGKTEQHRRLRAFLDLYGRFVRTRVKQTEPPGARQWWRNVRGGFARELPPPSAAGDAT